MIDVAHIPLGDIPDTWLDRAIARIKAEAEADPAASVARFNSAP